MKILFLFLLAISRFGDRAEVVAPDARGNLVVAGVASMKLNPIAGHQPMIINYTLSKRRVNEIYRLNDNSPYLSHYGAIFRVWSGHHLLGSKIGAGSGAICGLVEGVVFGWVLCGTGVLVVSVIPFSTQKLR